MGFSPQNRIRWGLGAWFCRVKRIWKQILVCSWENSISQKTCNTGQWMSSVIPHKESGTPILHSRKVYTGNLCSPERGAQFGIHFIWICGWWRTKCFSKSAPGREDPLTCFASSRERVTIGTKNLVLWLYGSSHCNLRTPWSCIALKAKACREPRLHEAVLPWKRRLVGRAGIKDADQA